MRKSINVFFLVLVILFLSLSVFVNAACDTFYAGTDYMDMDGNQDACYYKIGSCFGIPSEYSNKISFIECPSSVIAGDDFTIKISQSSDDPFDEVGYGIGSSPGLISFVPFSSDVDFTFSISQGGIYPIFIFKQEI